MCSFSGHCAASVPISTFMCLRAIYRTPGLLHIFSCIRMGTWKYNKSLTDTVYECRNWETEHYNSVLEITVSFLRIHKWEPDIYIGFSPALYLQCTIHRQEYSFCLQLELALTCHNYHNSSFVPLLGRLRFWSSAKNVLLFTISA
jgi:hypothetical protein